MSNPHQWVALIMVPIEVEVKEDDVLDIMVTEAADEISKEDAKIICWHCEVPMTTETYYTECAEELAHQNT